jgi:hypothetical protein
MPNTEGSSLNCHQSSFQPSHQRLLSPNSNLHESTFNTPYFQPASTNGKPGSKLYHQLSSEDDSQINIITIGSYLVTLVCHYTIAEQQLQHLESCFREFVTKYKEYYYCHQSRKLPACLPTIHMLLHVADNIWQSGAMWAHIQWTHEWYCGTLGPMVKFWAAPFRNLSFSILHLSQVHHVKYTANLQPEIAPSASTNLIHVLGSLDSQPRSSESWTSTRLSRMS